MKGSVSSTDLLFLYTAEDREILVQVIKETRELDR